MKRTQRSEEREAVLARVLRAALDGKYAAAAAAGAEDASGGSEALQRLLDSCNKRWFNPVSPDEESTESDGASEDVEDDEGYQRREKKATEEEKALQDYVEGKMEEVLKLLALTEGMPVD